MAVDFELEMKKEFIVGARKLLGTIEELIQNLGKELAEDDGLKLLFRKLNNLKGGAVAVGFRPYTELVDEIGKVILKISLDELKIDEKVLENLEYGRGILLEINNTYLHDINDPTDFKDQIEDFKKRLES